MRFNFFNLKAIWYEFFKYIHFILAPLAKSEDLEDNEKQEVESDKKIVTGNEIVEATEEPEKEMTVSANMIICRWPALNYQYIN